MFHWNEESKSNSKSNTKLGSLRRITIISLLSLLVTLTFAANQPVLAHHQQAPKQAVNFAEAKLPGFIDTFVYGGGDPQEWGFAKKKGIITYSQLYPVNKINAAFAMGDSLDLITDNTPVWVTIVKQNEQPVNAVGIHEREDGSYELIAFDYPPELIQMLPKLQNEQHIVHHPPSKSYYVYATSDETLQLLDKHAALTATPINKEEFQQWLMQQESTIKTYGADHVAQPLIPEQAPFRSEPSTLLVYPGLLLLLAGISYFYWKRKHRARSEE